MKEKTSAAQNKIVIYLTPENLVFLQKRLAKWSANGLDFLSLSEIAQGCITLIRQQESHTGPFKK